MRSLGERESGTARLEEAVAAYREALQEWTRERVPLDWAMTQNNLGLALQRLGERESGTARLEAAVATYRDALTERTREAAPDLSSVRRIKGGSLPKTPRPRNLHFVLPRCFPERRDQRPPEIIITINLLITEASLARPERFELPTPKFEVWCSYVS